MSGWWHHKVHTLSQPRKPGELTSGNELTLSLGEASHLHSQLPDLLEPCWCHLEKSSLGVHQHAQMFQSLSHFTVTFLKLELRQIFETIYP